MVPASRAALLACNRFGLGARPGDLARVAPDPRGALKAELARPDAGLIDPHDADTDGLGGTTANLQAAFAAQEARREARARDAGIAAARAALPGIGSDAAAGQVVAKPGPRPAQAIYRGEALARFRAAAEAELGFVERLVAFWSNHFCVSATKSPLLRACAGSFEREAIRPHVLGSFADMLQAVERHPAMLLYLDNARSVGPDSPAGRRRQRGLNENFAREIMELHTLGVDGGYAQGDVTALARVLTGWTFAGRDGRLGEPGTFVFNARAHEPGDDSVVGRAYGGGGLGQGEAALADFARHPATAHHVATKLARHFVADDPPPAAVDRLARVFLARDGDLRALAAALVEAPECWADPPAAAKLRNPYDLAVATARLLGPAPDDPGPILGALAVQGMPLWEPPGPDGFPDVRAAWGSPEGMKLRLDLAARTARHADPGFEPAALFEAAAGAAGSDATRAALAGAESREQGLALLLMSPEFQRR